MARQNIPKPQSNQGKKVATPPSQRKPSNSKTVSPGPATDRLSKQSKQQGQEARSSQAALKAVSQTTQANRRSSLIQPLKPIPQGDIEIRPLDPLFYISYTDDEFESGLNPVTVEELEKEGKKLKEKIKELPSLTPATFATKLYKKRNLQVYSLRNKKEKLRNQELFYVSSTVPQEEVDEFLRIKYGEDFKNLVRKVIFPTDNFCVKDTLHSTVNITESYIQQLVYRFKTHCFQHPQKGPIFELAGFNSESFEEFFREKIEFCINNLKMCACIVEGSELRFFVYGGDVEGIILNTNEPVPRYYWFGFQQRRLTKRWFRDPKTIASHDEQDQIFNAAVLRRGRIDMALAMAENENVTTRRKRRIKQFARQLMEQLRRDNPSDYNSFVEKMLDAEVIWSQYDLRFGTGWPIYDYTYAYKDLKDKQHVALAEADVGPFLEVQRMTRANLNSFATHLPN